MDNEVAIKTGETGYGVLESKAGYTKFMNLLAGEQNCLLTILDPE